MTWIAAKARAAELLRGLRSELTDRDVRLVLRALTREFHQTKPTEMKPDRVLIEDSEVIRELTRLGALEHLSALKHSGKRMLAFGGDRDTWLLTHDNGNPNPEDNGWTLAHWPLDLLAAGPAINEWLKQLGLEPQSITHVPLAKNRN